MKNLRTLLLAATFAAWSRLAICPATFAADATPSAPPVNNAKRPSQLVEPLAAQKLISNKLVQVLDVRTPAEFAAGHIAGATNLDFNAKDFQAKVAALDKNQPYLVQCASGNRSAKACTAMEQIDFKTLYDLKGGIKAWEAAGLPVEK